MKLIIKQGECLDNALQYLQDYLAQFKEEYPILKGNMNINVNLEGFDHRVCPENEGELVLTGENTFDLSQSRKDEAFNEVLNVWKREMEWNAREIKNTHIDIERDNYYLATAEEKGKRQDLIDNRKKQLAENEEWLESLTQQSLIFNKFDNALVNGNARIHYVKHKMGNSVYTYTMECIIVFDNIDGLYGYCDRHGFKTGLPYWYKN